MAQSRARAQVWTQTAMNDLRRIVQGWYPSLHMRTYCVPPCIMNRVPYYRTYFAGQPVLTTHPPAVNVPPPPVNVPPPPQVASQVRSRPAYSLWSRERQPHAPPTTVQETDYREDRALQHILHCLRTLGVRQMETMLILSQLDFSHYLNQPSYAAAAAHLPRPTDLPRQYREGDFDLLVLHRHYGVLIGELKSVGITRPATDADVNKRVWKAVRQLDKSETVVRHIVSDMAPGLSVRKTLILPYITTTQLQRVLDADHNLEQVRGIKIPHLFYFTLYH